MATQGVYCGSAKVRQTRFGDQFEIRMFADEVERLTAYLAAGGLRSARIDVCARREPKDEWTHYLKVNEWTPPAGGPHRENERQAAHRTEPEPAQPALPVAAQPPAEDDIPF